MLTTCRSVSPFDCFGLLPQNIKHTKYTNVLNTGEQVSYLNFSCTDLYNQ